MDWLFGVYRFVVDGVAMDTHVPFPFETTNNRSLWVNGECSSCIALGKSASGLRGDESPPIRTEREKKEKKREREDLSNRQVTERICSFVLAAPASRSKIPYIYFKLHTLLTATYRPPSRLRSAEKGWC
jgi:hypothetical protein